jgi:hypothetical protein
LKVLIEIPDWTDLENKQILIMNQREVIAKKEIGQDYEYKTVRCNYCGVCCHDVGADWLYGRDENNICLELKYQEYHHGDGTVQKGWMCTAKGSEVPFSCTIGRDPDPNKCVIRYKKGTFKIVE